MSRDAPFVVFGAGENAHKGVICYSSRNTGGWAAKRKPMKKVDWIVIGAMTGPGSKAHQPKKEWIAPIVEDAQALSVPVFMKDSLIPIVGEENMRREFPWQ